MSETHPKNAYKALKAKMNLNLKLIINFIFEFCR